MHTLRSRGWSVELLKQLGSRVLGARDAGSMSRAQSWVVARGLARGLALLLPLGAGLLILVGKHPTTSEAFSAAEGPLVRKAQVRRHVGVISPVLATVSDVKHRQKSAQHPET